MGRIIRRGFLYLSCFAVCVIAWFVFAREISLLVDMLRTAPVESRSLAEFRLDSLGVGTLRIDDITLNTARPDLQPTALRMNLNAEGQLHAEKNGRSITLGRKADSLGTIRPAIGESARFGIERSLLRWPTPLELNFMAAPRRRGNGIATIDSAGNVTTAENSR